MNKFKEFFVKNRNKKIKYSMVLAAISFVLSFTSIFNGVFYSFAEIFFLFGSALFFQDKCKRVDGKINYFPAYALLVIGIVVLLILHLFSYLLYLNGSYYFAAISVLFAKLILGYICFWFYIMIKQKKWYMACIFFAIAITLLLYIILGADPAIFFSTHDGCRICGDDIFAGSLCEEHFNDFVLGLSKK